ncbi:MAG: S8 family serine peptidase [Deltaproteobacteria bacterium]|nr:S8 family serine peptidase [Deltaproteobacteria bacterium]
MAEPQGKMMRSTDRPTKVWGRRTIRFVGEAMLFLLTACGTSSQSTGPSSQDTLSSLIDDGYVDPLSAPNVPSNENAGPGRTSAEPLLERDRSHRYAGYVKIMFHNEPGNTTDLRWERGAFVARKSGVDTRGLNAVLRKYAVADVQPGVAGVTEAQMTVAYAYMVQHNIPGAYDWNGLYKLMVPDETAAQACAQALGTLPLVRAAWVHFTMPDLGGLDAPTPDFTPEQKYLQSNESTGGLNVVAAWNPPYTLTGDGIHIETTDDGAVVGHEDLPLTQGDVYITSSDALQHGTATAGVLVGIKNDIGVTGISHGAKMRIWDKGQGASGAAQLAYYYAHPEGDGPFAREGDIHVVMDPGSCDMPAEADLDAFLGIQQLVGMGSLVVEGVANAGKALHECAPNETMWGTPAPYLTEDSGAILVGASEGASHYYNPISNCGPRVDVYAWGKEVITTGYGDYFPGLDQKTEENTTRWYNYAYYWGTSAATAQIGGVVTLLQEYVRKQVCPNPAHQLGDPGQLRCYLPPKTMRQLLKDAGAGNEALMPDPGNPGQAIPKTDCPIGVQPDVGKALQLLDTGAYAPEVKLLPAHYQVVSGIRYDMDGDGRAELISFSRDGKWYVDLSATPPPDGSPDGYGAWDLILDPSASAEASADKGPLPQGMWFPVVHDYNSDGRADLALYDSKNGRWYIRFTDTDLLAGTWGGWDRVLDYSTDPNWKSYSRPVPGDFNGDHWLDPALTTPDGHWLIDYGGFTATLDVATKTVEYSDTCGAFDEAVPFLTEDQLAAAPGWAYVAGVETNGNGAFSASLSYKAPDGETIPNAEKITTCYASPDGTAICSTAEPFFDLVPIALGGMDVQFIPIPAGTGWSFKGPDGTWKFAVAYGWAPSTPEVDYGGLSCRPAPADYDGDTVDDRVVQCGTEWRIAYSGSAEQTGKGTIFPTNADGFRIVEEPLGILDPLPGYVYGGGIAYQELKAIFEYYGYGEKNGTIFGMSPPPIGPYFPQCLKYWAVPAPECLSK